MPGMDDYTATNLIREWELDHGVTPTHMIALTMYALRDGEERSLSAGCTARLTKPIKCPQWLEAIEQFTKKVTV